MNSSSTSVMDLPWAAVTALKSLWTFTSTFRFIFLNPSFRGIAHFLCGSKDFRFKEEAAPWYSDQIIPFDITLAGTNELGAAATMKIFGVEILDEGSGISIDDA